MSSVRHARRGAAGLEVARLPDDRREHLGAAHRCSVDALREHEVEQAERPRCVVAMAAIRVQVTERTAFGG